MQMCPPEQDLLMNFFKKFCRIKVFFFILFLNFFPFITTVLKLCEAGVLMVMASDQKYYWNSNMDIKRHLWTARQKNWC